MSQQLSLVIESIAKSEQLLEIAAQGDWDVFFEVDQQRQSELTKLKLDAVELDDDELIELTDNMLRLIALNQQLESICQHERQMIVEKLHEFKKGNNAHKAYSS
ncbi:MAG: flagellar protein FliT [Gammaproteobacteria bacterium]|nr:flagellar protein FliT [Gammaproteobacteria bacterium]